MGASARSALPRSSYGDAFTVRARASHTAEQWARQAFESGPRAQRRLFSLVVWQGLLGLRLSPEGVPGTVAGWDIAVNESGTLVLRADSWICLVTHLDHRTGPLVEAAARSRDD